MATPTQVQHVAAGMSNQNGCGTFTITLPNTVLSGNLVIVGFQYNSGLTLSSVKDDGGNSFTSFVSQANTTNAQTAAIYYLANDTFSSKQVVITFTGTITSACRAQAVVEEWYNIATSSVTDGSSAAMSTPSKSAGSFTPGTSGDLIWQYGIDLSDNTAGPAFNGTSITVGSGFTLTTSDLSCGVCTQYQVQSSAGAINPAFTTSGSATWGSLAVAFKSASAGTAPSSSAMRIVNIQHSYMGASTATAALSLAFPSQGNLLVGIWTTGDQMISSVADGNSNSWKVYAGLNGQTLAVGSVLAGAQIVFAANATTGGTVTGIKPTLTGTTAGGNSFILYDVVNAATSPLAAAVTTAASQSANANLATVNIYPSNSSSLVIAAFAVTWHTVNGMTGPTGGVLDSVVNSFEDNGTGGTSASTLDEDNGYAHVYPTGTTELTFTWTYNHSKASNLGVGNWNAVAVAFNASGQTGTQPVLVQQAAGTATSGTTCAAAFANNTTTGNTVLALTDVFDGTNLRTISGVAITPGSGTFASIVEQAGSANNYGRTAAWGAPNITGGTTPTVTVTYSGATSAADLVIYEWTNMPTTIQTDGTSGKAGTSSASLSTNAITTTNANDLIMAGFSVGQTGTLGESGWGWYIATENTSIYEWWTVNATQTSLSATATQSSAAVYNAIIFALKGAASGPTNVNATWSANPKATLTMAQTVLAKVSITFNPKTVLTLNASTSTGGPIDVNVTITFNPKTALTLSNVALAPKTITFNPKASLSMTEIVLATKTITFTPGTTLTIQPMTIHNTIITFNPRVRLSLGASGGGQSSGGVPPYSFWGGGHN